MSVAKWIIHRQRMSLLLQFHCIMKAAGIKVWKVKDVKNAVPSS